MKIKFNHRRFTRALAWVIVLLVCQHLVVVISSPHLQTDLLGVSPQRVAKVFSLDEESNIPSWFSSTMLMLAAMLAGVCGSVCRVKRSPEAPYWYSLACLFVYLSLDETAMLHERIGQWIYEHYQLNGIFYPIWVIPFSVPLLACIVFFSRFVFRLPVHTRRILIASAIVYVSGAFGFELLGGLYSGDAWGELMLITTEETLEMVGVWLLVRGLFLYLSEEIHDVALDLE